MTRVLMTSDVVGGVWTYAVELARELAQHGVETTLAVMGPAPGAEQLAEADTIQVIHRPYKLEWMEDPWHDVDRAGEWLLQLEKEIRPDVIHLNGYAHGVLPFRAPKIVVGHSCVLSWWQSVYDEPAPRHWNDYRNRVRRGLEKADLIVAPSHAMRAALAAHYAATLRHDWRNCSAIRVIPNGCDSNRFHPVEKANLVLTAGRLWDRAKNLQRLDRIAPSLSWPVYAAGDGATSSNVETLGMLSPEEMRSWFARAAIYALPARYEPFGLSVLEAALSGCALVLGDIPSLRENWDGAALFASPDSEDELRAHLRALIESEPVRVAYQKAARQRALHFSAAKMANGYFTAYEAVRSHSTATFRS